MVLLLQMARLAVLAASVSALRLSKTGSTGLTNAQRFAQGLPPKQPQRLYGPSTSELLRRYPVPGQPGQYTGRINVTTTSGGFLGYVASTFDFSGDSEVTTDVASAGQFTIDTSSFPTGISIVNGDPTYPMFGGQVAPRYDLNQVDGFLGEVSQTPYGPASTCQQKFSPEFKCETQIWSIVGTSQLTLTWINPDGTPITDTFIGETGGGLLFGRDFEAFAESYGDAVEVNLYFDVVS